MNVEPVGTYRPEDPSDKLNVVLPRSVKIALEELSDAWNILDNALGYAGNWNMSKVVNRLLLKGMSDAWAEIVVKSESLKPEDRAKLKELVEKNKAKFPKEKP